MKTMDWLKTHKQEAAIGAGGIVIALALYVRSKNASSSSNSSGTTADESYALPATTADTTDSDAYSGLENQILGLQQAVLAGASGSAAAGSGTTTAAAAPSPAAPVNYGSVVGSGYASAAANGIASNSGTEYTGIPSGSIAASLLAGGNTLYYEPTAGNFDPIVPGLQPGTELYQQG